MYLESGELCSFMGCESCPNDREPNYYFPFDKHGNKTSDRIYHRSAKVYRYTYSLQADPFVSIDPKDVPDFFRSYRKFKDVTSEYMPTGEINMKLKTSDERTQFAYICVFNAGKWVPVSWSFLSPNSEVVFNNMGKDIVYLIGKYEDGILQPLLAPFLFSERK